MYRLVPIHVLLVSIVVLGCLTVQADTWGTLKGRFLYDGQPPAPKPLEVTVDKQYCAKFRPMDESLMVSGDRGLANVVVFVRSEGDHPLAIHSDYQDQVQQPAVLDNPECRFAPHVLRVLAGQKLVLRNPDPIGQAARVDFFNNTPLNVMIPSGDELEFLVSKAESLPVRVSCSIHPWECAYLVVRANPYMAISAQDGTFEIKNLPAGTHEFQFWQEKVGHLKDVPFAGGKTDQRGRATIEIGALTDLGVIKLSPSLFAGK